MRVHEIGEFDLIQRLENIIPQKGEGVVTGTGDDCAVLRMPGDLSLWTTDSTIEGVHFLPFLATPEQIGRKALLSNLSDIASMGGTPLYATISLSMPSDASVEWIERLYEGIAEHARKSSVAIVGGNTSRSPYGLRLDISVLGKVPESQILMRSGAEPGDVVLVTGTIGDAFCGLESVFNPTITVDPEVRNTLIQRYINPFSRLREARIIAESGIATAMIDISDGLSSDILHICDSSGTGVEIYASDLPISDAVNSFSRISGINPCNYALAGGDDYGLLLTAKRDIYELLIKTVLEETGTVLKKIGIITDQINGRSLVMPDGNSKVLGAEGWQHFPAVHSQE